MRKSSIAGITLTCGTIITIGWQLGIQGLPTSAIESVTSDPTTASQDAVTSPSVTAPQPTTSAPQPSVSAPAPVPAPVAADVTVTGASFSTRYGSVQVSVTFKGKVITDVTAIQLTNEDSRSVSISNRAAPMLRSSVLKSQSAKVSTVSGATYTSQGYLASVQSAIDKHNA